MKINSGPRSGNYLCPPCPQWSQGVMQREREVKSLSWQHTHMCDDIKPRVWGLWFPLEKRLRLGLREGCTEGFSISECFLYLNVSESSLLVHLLPLHLFFNSWKL